MNDRSHGLARLGKLTALLASTGVIGESSLESADFYNSPTFNANNVVGWVADDPKLIGFVFDLKDGKAGYFYAGSTGNSYWVSGGTSGQGVSFLFATVSRPNPVPLNFGLNLFNSGENWSIVGGANSYAYVGGMYFNASGSKIAFGELAQSDGYLMFKFTDGGEDYYGWIQVTMANNVDGDVKNLFVTIHKYAWQNVKYGLINTGEVAVPEPSAVVTSGIAALTGGAIALRRWRKERKPKNLTA